MRSTMNRAPGRRPLAPALTAAVAGALALAGPLSAEEPPPGPDVRRIETVRRVKISGAGGPLEQTMAFSLLGDALGAKPMKGAPFSATAVTEMQQTLADGNRISQKTSSALARDSAGRTRRELMTGAIGPLLAAGEPHKLIALHDPNTGTSTTLDPEARKAFRHTRPPTPDGAPPPGGGLRRFELAVPPPPGDGEPGARGSRMIEEDVVVMAPPPGAGPVPVIEALPLDAGKPVREQLGTQTIEGVKADGVRSTLTIPAGKMGNERPLVVTSERWFSPELGVVVLSRHSDPRLGTSTYRLTNIDRREPAAALFEIPAGYAKDEGPALLRRQIRRF